MATHEELANKLAEAASLVPGVNVPGIVINQVSGRLSITYNKNLGTGDVYSRSLALPFEHVDETSIEDLTAELVAE